MMQLFEFLTNAIAGNIVIALFAAFTWGIASILLSPCHLTSIPLIVGFVNGQGRITVQRAFFISLLFSLGIMVTIALIGLATAFTGRMLGDIGCWSTYLVAIVFILIGLVLLGILKFPDFGGKQPVYIRKGLLAAFILGLIFGLALGPCTFAYMAPILAVVFKAGMKNILYGTLLILAYAIGHCSVIVLAGTSTELVEKYLHWNERSKGVLIVKKICGLLIIVGGISMFFY
ncbi:MAG: cytochrome c biogenesis protein CcdA [Candidatus Margulisiibacteriota bacterium]